jgi:hypothetical protein
MVFWFLTGFTGLSQIITKSNNNGSFIHTVCILLQHTFKSSSHCCHHHSSGKCFQCWMFHFFCAPELSPCLSASCRSTLLLSLYATQEGSPFTYWMEVNWTVKSSWTAVESQSESCLMTDGQSAFLSWYQATIWALCPLFLSLHRNYLQTIAVFWSMGCPLWWEDGSVIYSHKRCQAMPALSLSGPSLTACRAVVEVF